MIREVWVWRPGGCVLKEHAPEAERGSAPYVIADGMDAIRNHADGRMYDSKSAYYKAVRAMGCEIIGGDKSFAEHKTPSLKPSITKREIHETYQRLRDQ